MDPEPYDVLAVELSSFQLHYTHSMAAESAAVLNVAEDHLDWYASMADYAADKGRIYERAAARLRLQRRGPGDRAAGPRRRRAGGLPRHRLHPRHARGRAWSAWSRTCSPTAPSSRSGRHSAAELCTVGDLASDAPHFVANALAAAALARSYGVPPAAVRDGLRAFEPDGHRIADWSAPSTTCARSTTPRRPTRTPRSRRCWPTSRSSGSPAGSPRAPGSTTWCGPCSDRLRGVVLLGRDRDVIAEALARHAPDVRVIEVAARGH